MPVVYDTGALLTAERGSRAVGVFHLKATTAGVCPIVPAPVLAQAWRGGPAHRLSLMRKSCTVLPVDEHLARLAGAACGQARTSDAVDALVVVVAVTLGPAVITSDPDDLHHLADAIGKLAIHTL